MELRHLRYFIRAAELMNFTRAAESLYVSQPTLSVQIHQLEEELGTELFARAGRSVRLTESGQVFLARARQAVRVLEEGEKEIDALKGLLRGSLNIASLPLYGSRLMVDWIAAFHDRYPLVAIRAVAAPSEDIEKSLLDGSSDIGLSFTPGSHPELSSRDLFEDEAMVIAGAGHKLARKKTISKEDLSSYPLILPSERISATRMISRFFEEQAIRPRIAMTFDDGHAMLELVKRGDFLTILPRRAVGESPDLRFLRPPAPGLKIQAGALWSHLGPAGAAFLELITDQEREIRSLS
ncbi:MAG: LysR substrate-binding domain-containing protein [Candidatus Obscuribacterales bacterium]